MRRNSPRIEDPVIEEGMEKPFEEAPRITEDSPVIELMIFKDKPL